MPAQPSSSRTIATPKPGEFAVAVSVPSHLIKATDVVVEGVKYKDTPQWMDKSLITSGYGDYVFMRSSSGGEETIVFYFGKNKTAAEAETPFREFVLKVGNFYWPPILLGVDIVKGMPRASNAGNVVYSGNTYEAVPIWIPSAETGSIFIQREFLGSKPFDILQWDSPIADAISFPVPGGPRFDFPECLHGDLTVDNMDGSVSEYNVSTDGVTNRAGLIGERFFPATNFKTWSFFTISDSQDELESGQWLRKQVEVRPPNLPRKKRGR